MRIRFGVTHPLPFLKNAGILAKDLNESDTKKAEGFKKTFFELAGLLALIMPAIKVTDEGIDLGKGFGIKFTLTAK